MQNRRLKIGRNFGQVTGPDRPVVRVPFQYQLPPLAGGGALVANLTGAAIAGNLAHPAASVLRSLYIDQRRGGRLPFVSRIMELISGG